MNEIKKVEPLAYDHLMEKGPKTWSKAFFQTDRACDAYENGISESFNLVIETARKRPLIIMLEEIQIYVMERIYRQKIKGKSWDLTICPSIRLNLSKLRDLQRFWKVIPSGYQQYEVKLGYDAYVVDIGSMTYAYRTWQLTSYPCVHGYACIANLNRGCRGTTSSHFPPKGEGYQEDHQQKEKWIRLREKTKEKKHSDTKRGSVKKYSICRESGHNRTTCPQKPIEESSNASKVKVALAHEVGIDNESEVEKEPESEVDSFDVEFEDDVQPEVQPKVQDEVQLEVQDEVQDEVQPEVQLEFHPEVQAKVQPEVQVQVEDANQIIFQYQVEIPSFQVVVEQRARKPSEIITKLKIRKK
ncbi:unnamed protein product [Lactuca saligna]|uniref:Zinc finger PMZ-type domain-containing protein n=1 Tax=Lactuca saligna TaxID=75948 RepID=A0AA35ZPG9_LACSI|nr:unnamed protein product [Lactuca saligna]